MKALTYLLSAVCAVALSAGAAKTANASTITETINFTANSFPAGAPVNPVIGSFTITFDPTVTVVGAATTITINSVNISPGAFAPFFFYNKSFQGGLLTVCSSGPVNNSCAVPPGTNGFDIQLHNLQSSPTFDILSYATSSVTNKIFQSGNGAFGRGSAVVVTPLPGALPLFASGAALLGFLGWRRKRTRQK